jgi:hypothetical protein
MERVQPWLAPFTWEVVTAQNAILCAAKNALHKPTSDGHDATMALWNSRHLEAMELEEAVDLCRRCHRMAPFCLYNGNTFASVIGLVVKGLSVSPAQHVILRSLAGHIVAGVASDEETLAFREFCASLG